MVKSATAENRQYERFAFVMECNIYCHDQIYSGTTVDINPEATRIQMSDILIDPAMLVNSRCELHLNESWAPLTIRGEIIRVLDYASGLDVVIRFNQCSTLTKKLFEDYLKLTNT